MAVDGEANCRTHAQDSAPLQSTQFAQINSLASHLQNMVTYFRLMISGPGISFAKDGGFRPQEKTGFSNIKLLIERGRVL